MLVMLGFATLAVLEVFSMVSAAPAPAPPPSDVRPEPQPVAAIPLAAPARTDSCSGRDLRVRKQDLESGPGVAYGRLVLTNTGRRPCTVQGYPVIEGMLAGRIALRSEPAPAPDGGPGPLIPLKPEQSASAAYRQTLPGRPGCARYDRTQVVVPHTVSPFPLDGIGVPVCGYRVQALAGGAGATWIPS